MNPASESTLEERRDQLRSTLGEQRQLIANRMLAPVPVTGFPRSHLMRWLVNRPRLTIRLALGMVFVLSRVLRQR